MAGSCTRNVPNLYEESDKLCVMLGLAGLRPADVVYFTGALRMNERRTAATILMACDMHVRCWQGTTRLRAVLELESTNREALEWFASIIGIGNVRGPYMRLAHTIEHEGPCWSGTFGEGGCHGWIDVYRYGRYNYRDVRAIALMLWTHLDAPTREQFDAAFYGYRESSSLVRSLAA